LASILEVDDSGKRWFNVFDAAPDNEKHRQQQQDLQQAGQGQGPNPPDYFL